MGFFNSVGNWFKKGGAFQYIPGLKNALDLGDIPDTLKKLVEKIEQIPEGIENIGGTLTKIPQGLEKFSGEVVGSIGDLERGVGSIAGEIGSIGSGIGNLAGEIGSIGEDIGGVFIDPLQAIAKAISGIGEGIFDGFDDIFDIFIEVLKFVLKFLQILFKLLKKSLQLFDILFYVAPALIDLYFLTDFLGKTDNIEIAGLDKNMKSIINTIIFMGNTYLLYVFYFQFGWNDFAPDLFK